MNIKFFQKIAYWLATAIMFYFMLFAIIKYHTSYEVMAGFFKSFGYPTYIVYPLAYLKLSALIAIATNYFNNLKEIAYGGYFINTCMALAAHLNAGHEPWHVYVLLPCIIVSYVLSNRVRGKPGKDFLVGLK